MAKYGTFLYGDGTTYGDGEAVFPIDGVQRIPWVFREVSSSDEYEFAINPLESSIPSMERKVSTVYTASGQPINFEGRPDYPSFTFSGTILHREHFEIMEFWFEKSHQVSLSDDLGRRHWVMLTSFNPTRNYNHQYPWRHEYSASAMLLSWD